MLKDAFRPFPLTIILLLAFVIAIPSSLLFTSHDVTANDEPVDIYTATKLTLYCWAQKEMGWSLDDFSFLQASDTSKPAALVYSVVKGGDECYIDLWNTTEKSAGWMQSKFAESQSWGLPFEWTTFHGFEALGNQNGIAYWRSGRLIFYISTYNTSTEQHEALYRCAQANGLFGISNVQTPTANPTPTQPPLSISITANPIQLSADGTSTATIIATVTRGTNPVPGEKIEFLINDDRNLLENDGVLSATSAVTDSQGKAQIIYRAPLIEDQQFLSAVIDIQAIHTSGNPKVNLTLVGGLIINVNTDKAQYEQGEAVTITGELLFKGQATLLRK